MTKLINNIKVDNEVYSIEASSLTGDAMKSIPIKYIQLKDLRDNRSLIPGTWYRITDYITTTRQGGTATAGHPFNVIVMADTESSFNENAHACWDISDSYFGSSNLSAWQIKYCLDNDGYRFAWADYTGYGVIYYMKDEHGNEAPYDFKNILIERESNKYYYTFDVEGRDTSTSWSTTVVGNIIKPCYDGARLIIGKNIFLGKTIVENYLDYNCSNNFFGNDCCRNKLGIYCSNNSFGESCLNNTLKDNCQANYFGGSCQGNTLGFNCSSIMLGDSCDCNDFGSMCQTIYCGSFAAEKKVLSYTTIGTGCSQLFIYCDKENNIDYSSVILPGTHPDLTQWGSTYTIALTLKESFAGINSNGDLRQWNPADLISSSGSGSGS